MGKFQWNVINLLQLLRVNNNEEIILFRDFCIFTENFLYNPFGYCVWSVFAVEKDLYFRYGCLGE